MPVKARRQVRPGTPQSRCRRARVDSKRAPGASQGMLSEGRVEAESEQVKTKVTVESA